MSMSRLQGAMRAQANMANQSKTFSRLGIVSAYDPNTYSVKVTFQPDGNETGWIPLGSDKVGAGFGIYAAPYIGDQIEVRFQEGDRDTGVAGPLVYDNQSPPLPVPSGEVWIVHKSGMSWKMTTDGKLSMVDAAGSSIVLNNDGTIVTHGNWIHTGTIKANGHAIDETHTHKNTQPQTGGVSGVVT